jgi:hypothetical protein
MSNHELPHPEHYTAGEGARRAALLVRAGVRIVRGKPVGRIEKKLDRLAEEAIEREAKTRAAKK